MADWCDIQWFSTGFGSSFVVYWQRDVVRMPSEIRIEGFGDASQFRARMVREACLCLRARWFPATSAPLMKRSTVTVLSRRRAMC